MSDENPNRFARRSDPETSKIAGHQALSTVAELNQWAAECVTRTPGLTQRELGDSHCPDDLRRIGRRLSECYRMGMVSLGRRRKCSITGKTAQTYWPSTDKVAQPAILTPPPKKLEGMLF